MKTVCIYHSLDLDGWMSAAIVKHWFEKDKQEVQPGIFLFRKDVEVLDFIGYNYGQPIPDLSGYDKVIMCDISFPKEEMSKLFIEKQYDNIVWIDHHISAINDINSEFRDKALGHIGGLRDTNFAACELTWKFFFPNEPMPEIVRLLGLYDSFRHKGTDEETKVLEFQYGARQCISNYEEAYAHLVDEGMNYKNPEINTLNIILEKGKSIYKYLCTEAKQTYKNGFEIFFRYSPVIPEHKELEFAKDTIYKFICINKERFNPINFGIDYHKDGYDGCACFYFDGLKYNFSLYNDNGKVDCSELAKRFDGGGHSGAAGFRLSIDDFRKLI